MEKIWLELFIDIGKEIKDSIQSLFGTEKAKKEIKINAFGEMSVYVDKIAEDKIINTIKRSKLPCMIVSEESGIVECGSKLPIVIVDPIDGSLNAKRGIPYYAFSIALSYGPTTNDIVLGYVLNINNGDEFYGIKNSGAFCNTKPIMNIESKDLKIICVEGLKENGNTNLINNLYSQFHRIRSMGSVALDMCYLAKGAFDAFVHLQPSRIVDYAASKIILEESNGIMLHINTNERFLCNVSMDKGSKFYCLNNKNTLKTFQSKFHGI